MKTLFAVLSGLGLWLLVAGGAMGQAPAAGQTATPPFSADELDQLLGPIALYPDPLIGLILPASTVPSDIVVADRFVQQNGDMSQVASQPWDDSVKGLTHYPDLLKWLDQNIAWATQVGTAYAAQPDDVMNSIQQLRAKAKADGTLATTPEQTVAVDDGALTITPTDAGTVYVPQYDPDAVYNDDYTADDGPVITYGGGYPVGPWLGFWPNWRGHRIFRGDWTRWRDFHGGAGAGFTGDPTAHAWVAAPGRPHVQVYSPPRTAIERPQFLPGVTVAGPRRAAVVNHTQVVSPPQGGFTGRGAAGPAVSRPVYVQPQAVTPQQPVYSGYGRGSDARAASERGAVSRQSMGGYGTLPAGGGGGAGFKGQGTSGFQGQGTGGFQGQGAGGPGAGGRFGH